MTLLAKKRGLIVGIANELSIAAGCARVFSREGAQLALTYLNKSARIHVAPVSEAVNADIFEPLDVENDDDFATLFRVLRERWGSIDFIVHSIAFCPREDLHGRVVDCSREGFSRAMDVSVHSFIRMARAAEPLMTRGGSLVTISYYGAERVVDHYSIMGPVKAALESSVRYLAAELGPKGIRVNAVSSGPVKTRAASGIAHFDELIDQARERAPQHRLVTIEDVGEMAAYLASDGARSVTGNIAYVDAGFHIMA